MPKKFSKQSRELVLNVLDYFAKEKNNGGPLLSVFAIQQRTADTLQISLRTVQRLCLLRNDGVDLEPVKRNFTKIRSIDLPDAQKQTIRELIYEMYAKKEHVSLDSLLALMKKRCVCEIKRTTLFYLLKNMGLRFRKTNHRLGLCEQSHVVSMRNVFLRKYLKNMNSQNPKQFVFLDETWVFSKGTCKHSWQDGSSKTLQQPTKSSNGKRYIIVHAGNLNGFIEGSSLIFGTHNKSYDYHDNMNSALFEKWFEESVLCRLEEPSIIILDNASYHSRKADQTPAASWNKKQIIDWLVSKNIEFDNFMLKSELLHLAKNSASEDCNKYFVDNLALYYGHEVLRLPPYHCQYNPIELIWGICKEHYDKNIGATSGREEQVLSTWDDALNKITAETWKKSIQHTETLIKDTFTREKIIDEVRPLIFTVNGEDSEDEDILDNFSDSDEEDCASE